MSDQLKHSSIEKDEDGLLWVVRTEEYEQIYGNRIICEAFYRTTDESHEEMIDKGYLLYGKHRGENVYVKE